MCGDAVLLGALVRNLVDNAVRHCRSEVRVSLRPTEDSVVLQVEDDGAGVPADLLPQLGRRFLRGPETHGEGSGLGLSIVRRIAQLHGADVRFGSGPQGPGLCVRVVFPS